MKRRPLGILKDFQLSKTRQSIPGSCQELNSRLSPISRFLMLSRRKMANLQADVQVSDTMRKKQRFRDYPNGLRETVLCSCPLLGRNALQERAAVERGTKRVLTKDELQGWWLVYRCTISIQVHHYKYTYSSPRLCYLVEPDCLGHMRTNQYFGSSSISCELFKGGNTVNKYFFILPNAFTSFLVYNQSAQHVYVPKNLTAFYLGTVSHTSHARDAITLLDHQIELHHISVC